MSGRVDIAVIGGGIAGASVGLAMARRGLAVTILEFQDAYRDQVRGEALSPWGMAEAIRMGVSDAFDSAQPAVLRRWTQWDEIYQPAEAPTVDITALCRRYVPNVPGAFAIHHSRTCEALARAAASAGAELHLGVRDFSIVPGKPPSVTYVKDGQQATIHPRIVIGAGGRHAPTARRLGLQTDREAHHWIAGLAVAGLDEWPPGVQAIGTEGHRMFLVFPQGDGRARLYLNFPSELRRRFSGPNGATQFLADFDLDCLPMSEMVTRAEPIGPCLSFPSYRTWLRTDPVAAGVVLIGDEAGANDPVLGTGLANALRDAAQVGDILEGSKSWDPSEFREYSSGRRERMRRLAFAADLLCTLSAEFGETAKERRRRAWDRMQENQLYGVAKVTALAGPDHVAAEAFTPSVLERLFREDAPKAKRSRFQLVRTAVGASTAVT